MNLICFGWKTKKQIAELFQEIIIIILDYFLFCGGEMKLVQLDNFNQQHQIGMNAHFQNGKSSMHKGKTILATKTEKKSGEYNG